MGRVGLPAAQVTEDGAEGAVHAGRQFVPQVFRVVIEIFQGIGDLGHVFIQRIVGHQRCGIAHPRDDAIAVGKLGERHRPGPIIDMPVEARRHPDRKGLRPVLIRMLLRVPARQVPDMTPAERLRRVVVLIRLRDGTEQLDPLLRIVEPVGVVHDVAHLVAEIAQHVVPVEAFDHADPLAMELHQFGVGKVERDGDRDGLERHAPFRRQIEAGPEPDSARVQLAQKIGDDGLEPGPFDGESEIPDGSGPEVGFLEGQLGLIHDEK